MAPATTGGASRAARKSQPTARVAQGGKTAASRSTVQKKRATPVVKGGRTGEVPKRPAAASASAVRRAKPTPQGSAPRRRAAPKKASSRSSAKEPAPSGSRRRAGSPRGDVVTTTTKAARNAATKATVKTAVKTAVTSTSPTTKETKKRASGASTVAKAAKLPRRTGAPATSRSAASKTTAQGKAAPERKATAGGRAQAKAASSAQAKGASERKATPERRAAAGRERKPTSRRAPAAPAGPYAQDEKFLTEQRQLLVGERAVYLAQASDLKAEADSLAQEREPGDVQFDEESGEGGTVPVDRERDLALSAQALAAVEEIDAALEKIANGTYGVCERCLQPIPKPRLKALPYARLCVACKSGGLSRR